MVSLTYSCNREHDDDTSKEEALHGAGPMSLEDEDCGRRALSRKRHKEGSLGDQKAAGE